MKKTLLLAITLVMISAASSLAQGRWSLGAELAFPQGDFADIVSTGIGISGRYEAPINDHLSWMATAGYISYMEKNDYGIKAWMLPLNGGIKYYVKESFNGFWFGGELGLTIVGVKVDNGLFGEDYNDSETKLGIAPQIGYHISNLDFSLRYSAVEDANFIGIRAAYVF
jgi:hypothetical protein